MVNNKNINRLVMVTAASQDMGELTNRLVGAGYQFTLAAASGDLVQKDTVTLLIGINEERYADLLELVGETCQRRRTYIPARMEPTMFQSAPLMVEAEVGGAEVITFEVDWFEQF